MTCTSSPLSVGTLVLPAALPALGSADEFPQLVKKSIITKMERDRAKLLRKDKKHFFSTKKIF